MLCCTCDCVACSVVHTNQPREGEVSCCLPRSVKAGAGLVSAGNVTSSPRPSQSDPGSDDLDAGITVNKNELEWNISLLSHNHVVISL